MIKMNVLSSKDDPIASNVEVEFNIGSMNSSENTISERLYTKLSRRWKRRLDAFGVYVIEDS